MKYNDPQHIKNYETSGIFPMIHDQIFSAIKRAAAVSQPVLDLGACLGLLSARMIEGKVTKKVFAFEPSQKALDIAIKKPEITYFKMGVTRSNIPKMFGFMIQNEVGTIVARRVFPEIAETQGVETVKEFGKAAYKAGVRKIVLEGRKQSSRSTATLKNADLEAECFSPFYKVIESFKDIRVLERVNDL
jgi:hypothetical protein